jgi:hypothetical protein
MTKKPEDPTLIEEGREPERKLSRRSMLAKLGLLGAAVYAAPVLITLSDAEARSRSRSRSGGRRRRRSRSRSRG